MASELGYTNLFQHPHMVEDHHYQQDVTSVVPRRVSRLLRLRDARFAGWSCQPPGNLLYTLQRKAEDDGIITYEEGTDLLMHDLLVYGTTGAGDQVFAVVDASFQVRLTKVRRVKRLAVILRKFVPFRIQPVVVGSDMTDEAAERACWDNVPFVPIEGRWY